MWHLSVTEGVLCSHSSRTCETITPELSLRFLFGRKICQVSVLSLQSRLHVDCTHKISPWWHFTLGNLRFLAWYAKAMNYIVPYWDLCLSYHLLMTLTHSGQFTSLAEGVAITLKMFSKILFKVFSKLWLGEMLSNEPCGAVICSDYHACPWSCSSSSSTPNPCRQSQLAPAFTPSVSRRWMGTFAAGGKETRGCKHH